MTRGERTDRAVLAILNSHAFRDGVTCVSQQLVADELGYTRETVNRSTQRLRASGKLILLRKERRPGSRFTHNVYRVRDWSPPLRSRALNHLARVRQAKSCSEAHYHSERTATAGEGSYAQATTPSVPFNALPGRFCLGTRREIDERRHECPGHPTGCMCGECQKLRDELQRLKTTFIESEEKLTTEVLVLDGELRETIRQKAALKRQLTKLHGNSPKAEEVRTVGAYWLHDHPRCKFPVGGKRWKTIEKALKDHEVHELLEALDGLRLMPFVGSHGRCAEGAPGAKRYDDVEHALRDESTIERFRGYAAQAKASRVEKLHTVCVRTGLVHDVWAGLLLDALCANGHG